MKHHYLIIAAVAAALCLTFTACQHTSRSLRDADATAADEDAHERGDYEWMILHDPATGRIPAHIREKELLFAASLPGDAAAAKGTAVNWQSRGPWNVGGRTRAFAIDAANENNLIAGSASGGMWRSTDGGASWSTTTPLTSYQSVSCVTQDTRAGHKDTWYYGTGEASGASASASGAYYLGNGIYKSTDGGATWAVLPSTTSNLLTTFDVWADVVWNIVTNPADMNQDVVFAAAYGGIYKSVNGGTSWSLVKGTFNNSVSYYTDIAITSTGVLYATLSSDGPQRGIYRSTDGITFTNITPASFPATYNRLKIGISPSDESQVYILGNTPGYGYPDTTFTGDIDWNSLWKYKYVSGDGSGTGGIWQDRSMNLPSTGGQFDKFQSQGSYDLVVKVKPNDTNTVFIGGTNLYRSTSGFGDAAHTTFIGGYAPGASQPVVDLYPAHHPDQHELQFLPSDPNKMISTNDGGIFRTNSDTAAIVTWNPLNNGYLTSMFYTCAIDHASLNDIIIGGAQDNGSWFTSSPVATAPWVTPRGGDGSYCAIADHGAAYYFSIQNGKVMRAKLNVAGNVDSFARIDPAGGTGYLFINPYVLDPNNNNLMYLAGGKYLWRNNNLSGIPYASNWDSISTNWVRFPDSVAIAGAKVTAIAVSKVPANRVYYGTSSQKIFRIDNANTGTPTPVNITSVSPNAPFPNANVSCIAVDPTNADHILAVFSNYGVYSLFYSPDGGANWTKSGGNLEANIAGIGNGPSCRWASIIPVAGGSVYLVGTSIGLFATTHLDSANTVWVQQGTATIGNSVVDMIDYRATDGQVTVATHSHGIFSARIPDINVVTGIYSPNAVKPDFHLLNFPNPFSSETNIQFNLKSTSAVSLNIYDGTGRLVRKLAEGTAQAGKHTYVLSGQGLAAGTYYCVLKSGGYSDTRKIMLMP